MTGSVGNFRLNGVSPIFRRNNEKKKHSFALHIKILLNLIQISLKSDLEKL